jgi:hypothetical protein
MYGVNTAIEKNGLEFELELIAREYLHKRMNENSCIRNYSRECK